MKINLACELEAHSRMLKLLGRCAEEEEEAGAYGFIQTQSFFIIRTYASMKNYFGEESGFCRGNTGCLFINGGARATGIIEHIFTVLMAFY